MFDFKLTQVYKCMVSPTLCRFNRSLPKLKRVCHAVPKTTQVCHAVNKSTRICYAVDKANSSEGEFTGRACGKGGGR